MLAPDGKKLAGGPGRLGDRLAVDAAWLYEATPIHIGTAHDMFVNDDRFMFLFMYMHVYLISLFSMVEKPWIAVIDGELVGSYARPYKDYHDAMFLGLAHA